MFFTNKTRNGRERTDMNNSEAPLCWVLPPRPISKDGSVLNEVFSRNKGGASKNIPNRRSTIDGKPRRVAKILHPALNSELKALKEGHKTMEVGSDYDVSIEKPFTRLQKRTMSLCAEAAVVPKPAKMTITSTKQEAKNASPKKAQTTPKNRKPKATAPNPAKKPKVLAVKTSSEPCAAVPEVPPAVRHIQSALAHLDMPSVPSFAEIMASCQLRAKHSETKPPLKSPQFFFSRFPDMATFLPCADGISYCRLANATGMIRLEAHRTRKISFTEAQSVVSHLGILQPPASHRSSYFRIFS